MTHPERDQPTRELQLAGEYESRLQSLRHDLTRCEQRWNRWGWVRGSLFLIAATLFGFGLAGAWGWVATWFWIGGGVALAFLVVAYLHAGLEEQLVKQRLSAQFLRQSAARLKRDWESVPEVPVGSSERNRPLALDLDLFGRASLIKLLGTVATPMGRSKLTRWMLETPSLDEMGKRQQAVKELAAATDHRTQLQWLAKRISMQFSDPVKLIGWAQRPVDRLGGRAMLWLARLIAAGNGVLLLALLIHIQSIAVLGPLLLAGLAAGFLITVATSGRIHGTFNEIAARQRDAEHYLQLLTLVQTAEFDSPYLKRLQSKLKGVDFDGSEAGRSVDPSEAAQLETVESAQNRLPPDRDPGDADEDADEDTDEAVGDGTIDAATAFGMLKRRTGFANLRRHALLYLVYLMLQFLFLWDVHVLDLLRRWRDRFGWQVVAWFDAIGSWETVAALGTLSADHPDWVFPEFEAGEKAGAKWVASQLGHPLIPQDERVCNDVEIGPPGSILLVTGSNMSGKSTLLRSIGLNTILAQMGGPVCASQMRMPCVEVQTSMRVSDSLADGVSFYFAELQRLKEVVSAAEARQADKTRALLYLLDEILQGTNSRERQIAVCQVLRHLVNSQAIGAISTHDLALVSAPGLADAFRPVHFRETIQSVDGERTMTFDYRMREGVATTTNALELLRMVGLGEPDAKPLK